MACQVPAACDDETPMTTLTKHFALGEPQVAGPLAVFPVFGPDPALAYRPLAEAIALGAFVKEVDGVASVNDLLVDNPTDRPLLIFEGEEVLGAKQNRTFDSSVLVDARSRTQVPVSCVEQGRWSPGGEADRMAPAPQAADPGLRRVKRAAANRAARAGAQARADQGEVWRTVSDRLRDHGVDSDSAALSDVYDRRLESIGDLAGAASHHDGQLGALAAIGGEPRALDLVSRPEVFASLLPRLAQGYALDALGEDERPLSAQACEAFLHAALDAPRAELPAPGMGRGMALAGSRVVGSGLQCGGELVQLSVFAADNDAARGAVEAGGRIGRPSRRRPR